MSDSNQEPNRPRSQSSLGLLTALLAFCSWGLVPIYWKLLHSVSSMEILAHRLLWSFVFSALLLAIFRRWSEVRRLLRSRRQIGMAILSGAFICLNWYIFIWAVNSGYIVQTSLGYFMTPLVNILLGWLLFGERLRPVQWAAIGLAALGVLNLTFGYGAFPWIALSLCGSFAVYGLLRKTSRADSLPGLFLESAAILPFAVGYLLFLANSGASAFEFTLTPVPLLLIGGGVITALPLLWFAHAARNLKFSTLGLLQYLGPSISFLVGVFIYREPFTLQHLVTFGCIWAALAIYTAEGYIRGRRSVATASAAKAEPA